ncbi:MAG: PepSY-like domain-containing protein [Chryseolinea sp.]
MKYTALTILSFVAFVSNGQKVDSKFVPDAIHSNFVKKFPHAKSVAWSMEGEDEYEAEFTNAGVEQSSNFNKNGKWLVTETAIKVSQLPSAIQSSIDSEYNEFKIKEAEKVEDAANQIFYEVELEKRELKIEVKFAADGKTISKEEYKD